MPRSAAATLVLAVSVLAAVAVDAASITCDAAALGTNDAYDQRGVSCAGFQNCTDRLCACTNSPSTSSVAGCLANATSPTCSGVTACLRSYVHDCLNGLAVEAADNSVDACAAWAITVQAELIAAVDAGQYAGSVVQRSCDRVVCEAVNLTGLGGTCAATLGTNNSAVCSLYAIPVPTDAPVQPANWTGLDAVTVAPPTPGSGGSLASGVAAVPWLLPVAAALLRAAL